MVRAVREHSVALRDAVARIPAVLDARDGYDCARRVDLANADVRQPDVSDLALLAEARERAHALRERHGGVGRVQLIDVDAAHPERAAGSARTPREVLGLRVAGPRAIGAPEAALCRDDDLLLPPRKRARDESLVVADVVVVEAVDVGGVEERDARRRTPRAGRESSRPPRGGR